ncbi:MAG TPA: response regulator [Polyangiaceae bacterium]|nr:response regulator [Polyangiaceae bacterium]
MLRVLVVDDSPVMRRMLTKSLEMAELPIQTIYEAGDGQTALDVLANNWIDLVLCDINMPQMNGVELMEHISRSAAMGLVPVIMVTTETSEPRLDYLKKLGVRACLAKPFRPEALGETVRQILHLESEA